MGRKRRSRHKASKEPLKYGRQGSGLARMRALSNNFPNYCIAVYVESIAWFLLLPAYLTTAPQGHWGGRANIVGLKLKHELCRTNSTPKFVECFVS